MKKIYIILSVVFVLLFVFLFFRFFLGGPEDTWICEKSGWVKHGQPDSLAPVSGCGGNKKVVCSENTPENCPDSCVVCPPCPACSSISCQTEEFCQGMGFDKNWYSGTQKKVTNFNECVASGNPVMESYPRQCRANGENFTENIGNELDKSDLIRLDYPRPNQEISSPLTIKGTARGSWFFEGSFPVKLVDENNKIIVQGVAQAQGDWMTKDFVPFETKFDFDSPETIFGKLILSKDNPSGLLENEDSLEVPVKFANSQKMQVKIYFSNQALDSQYPPLCEKVFGAYRSISRTTAPARAVMEELLKGPSETEKKAGFSTSINNGVKLQKISIEKNIAKVDFSEELNQGVAGSCRVGAIRAQIESTLKEFSTIKEVIISVNGRVDDILQP